MPHSWHGGASVSCTHARSFTSTEIAGSMPDFTSTDTKSFDSTGTFGRSSCAARAAGWRSTIDGPSAEVPVVHMGVPLYWSWLRDGDPFVHSGGQGGDAFLGEVGLWDRTREPVSTAPGGFRAPGTSADGRYRAFAVRQGNAYRIVVESVDVSVDDESVPLAGGAGALVVAPAASSLTAKDWKSRSFSVPIASRSWISVA